MKINIGKNANIDLDVLLRTRLLIQANSGGGKSWCIRRIAEQAFGKMQIIIIDPEGEFATLREKYGYVLVGVGGETPADPRSAALVAEKLLELHASAICDLFESFRKNPQGRHTWVKNFCNALLDAPKKLWHPVLIIVDEFHKYVPEKGSGESEASEAVIGIGTAGRKRGYCLVGATQRLGKVRKDVSAELLNRLVGPTFEDVDLERAADLLSVIRADKAGFFEKMRMLEPGHFYALGRAICKVRTLIKIGGVQTTHPEIGKSGYNIEPPPPPHKIKALLPKLSDLPQMAEVRAQTEKELRSEIANLHRDLTLAKKNALDIQPHTAINEIRVPIFKNGEVKRLEAATAKLETISARFITVGEQIVNAGRQLKDAVVEIANSMRTVTNQPKQIATLPVQYKPTKEVLRMPVATAQNISEEDESNEIKLGRAERSILVALAQHPTGLTKRQVAVFTVYAMKGGGFANAWSYLRKRRCLHEDHSGIAIITEIGLQILGDNWQPLPTGHALYEYWREELPKAESEILRVAYENYPNELSKESIAAQTISADGKAYEPSGGGFNNALSRLRTLMLVVGKDSIKATDEFFIE